MTTIHLPTIYIFIPVSGYLGSGPNALLCPGGYNADGPDLESFRANIGCKTTI